LRARRQRGYSLLEVIISMTIFGTFLAIAFGLTAEMRRWEKRLPVNFMRNPQIISVIARMRRDVQDVALRADDSAHYIDKHDGYEMGPKILILQTGLESGSQIIVWDLSESGVVHRVSYNVGNKSVWTARGVPPEFTAGATFKAVEFSGRPYGVRLIAKDSNGLVSIDQILQPRSYH
jgi:prepilin-type N-terminal cleavage/methylation domain-containing protein